MSPTIVPRDEAAEQLGIAPTLLLRYEARGLVRVVRQGRVEGYEPAELRRVWTILSFQRDLGINLAGIEVILRLREQMAGLHLRLRELARDLNDAIEAEGPADHDA